MPEGTIVCHGVPLAQETAISERRAHLFGRLSAVGERLGWADWNDESVRADLRPVRDSAVAAYAG